MPSKTVVIAAVFAAMAAYIPDAQAQGFSGPSLPGLGEGVAGILAGGAVAVADVILGIADIGFALRADGSPRWLGWLEVVWGALHLGGAVGFMVHHATSYEAPPPGSGGAFRHQVWPLAPAIALGSIGTYFVAHGLYTAARNRDAVPTRPASEQAVTPPLIGISVMPGGVSLDLALRF